MQNLNSRTSPVKPQATGSFITATTTSILGDKSVPYDPHETIAQMILNCQNPRLFFNFDKDNAEKMFGYRVRYLGPEDDENEDICYAYRHVPAEILPVIPKSPRHIEVQQTSPRVL